MRGRPPDPTRKEMRTRESRSRRTEGGDEEGEGVLSTAEKKQLGKQSEGRWGGACGGARCQAPTACEEGGPHQGRCRAPALSFLEIR